MQLFNRRPQNHAGAARRALSLPLGQSTTTSPSKTAPPATTTGATTTPFDPDAAKPPASTTTETTSKSASTTTHTTASSGTSSGSSTTRSSTTGSTTSGSSTAGTTTSGSFANTPPPSYTPSGFTYGSSSTTDGFSMAGTGTSIGADSTQTPASTGHLGTVTIIGIAAGGLIAVAVAIAIVMFFVRRLTKKRHDDALGEAFDRGDFVRHSAAIPDEEPPSMHRPRPPTMIDRHINRPMAQPQQQYYNNGNNGYPQQHGQQYGGYGQQADYAGYQQGYYQQPSFHPGEVLSAPNMGYNQYDSPAQSPIGDTFVHEDPTSAAPFLNHQVGGGRLSPTSATSGRSLTHLADLGRGQSVTPYQAAQYAEISKRLHDAPMDGTAEQAYARLDRQPQMPRGGQYQQRPMSGYDAEDAYGGI